MAKLKQLLFVDTNIWLDFYRARNDAGLALLKHLEAVSDRLIVTYQLEMEFKKNRHAAIVEGMRELKAPDKIPRPAIFSDAQATKAINTSLKQTESRVKALKKRLLRAVENPTAHDPVYQACQRVFHKNDSLVLGRDDPKKIGIRRKAFRRFLHGCPPRKTNDTSFGDAFNWEWMVRCAIDENAELVIVSRDSDYGTLIGEKAYINDHLRQEFSERISNKRKLLLYTRLAEALKHFAVPVSKAEVEAETEIVLAKSYLVPVQRAAENAKWLELFNRLTIPHGPAEEPDVE